MSNTSGTLMRIIGMMLVFVCGWFLTTTVLYAMVGAAFGLSFSWTQAVVVFAIVITARMFYPRNVFTG